MSQQNLKQTKILNQLGQEVTSTSVSIKEVSQALGNFFIASDTDTKQADDITANVPKFIPANVFKFASATNENILVALSSDEDNALYVYQYYVSQNRRLQSAWSKYTFGTATTDKILNVDFIENELFLVNERSDGVYLEKINVSPALTDTGETYLTHLDRKLNNTQITEVIIQVQTKLLLHFHTKLKIL